MATQPDWLRRVPPLRYPRGHRHHHHREIGEVILMGFGYILLFEIVLCVWMLELECWVMTWAAIGTWRAAVGLYRLNPIGRAASTPAIRPAVAVDPNPTPIDLAQWDGPMRRRT